MYLYKLSIQGTNWHVWGNRGSNGEKVTIEANKITVSKEHAYMGWDGYIIIWFFPRNLAMHSDGEDDESDYMSDDDW